MGKGEARAAQVRHPDLHGRKHPAAGFPTTGKATPNSRQRRHLRRPYPNHTATRVHRGAPPEPSNPRTQNPNSYSHRPVPRSPPPKKNVWRRRPRKGLPPSGSCMPKPTMRRDRPADKSRKNLQFSAFYPYLCRVFTKGCLTIRLRLYPLYRIRVMPRPGHVFPSSSPFSVL